MIPTHLLAEAEAEADREYDLAIDGITFVDGVEWLFQRLCEMSEAEFDENAITAASFEKYKSRAQWEGRGGFVEGARHQHALSAAALLKARQDAKDGTELYLTALEAERARCELFKNALTEISKLKNSDFAGQYSIMAAKIARQALSGEG